MILFLEVRSEEQFINVKIVYLDNQIHFLSYRIPFAFVTVASDKRMRQREQNVISRNESECFQKNAHEHSRALLFLSGRRLAPLSVNIGQREPPRDSSRVLIY